MDTTKMHSEAEVLLAAFDTAVENGTASVCGQSAEWVALVEHVWGRIPTPAEWRQWVAIMRAAQRDDVCYRA